MSISCITIRQAIIDNTSWYFVRHNFSRGGSDHHSCGAFPHKQRTKSRGVHRDKEQQQQNKNRNIKTSLPASLTNSATLPGNGAKKQYLMTLNYRGSFVAFLINKSVEPNEEQKVLVSDFDKEITSGTER